MPRLEQIKRARYLIKVQWKYEIDNAVIQIHELLAQTIVFQGPLIPDKLCRVRNVAVPLQYKEREGGSLQYVDVMKLYTYIRNYFMFPVGHHIIQVSDPCKDKEDLV